jgi:hypothetical protein
MRIEGVSGEWHLVASTSTRSEIAFDGDEPDPQGVSNWLNGSDNALAESAAETSGMVLSISPDGSFTEKVTGEPQVYWFDEEGVLAQGVSPFDGVIAWAADRAYLKPRAIANWAIPEEGRYAPALLRYDDGDTKIADQLRFEGHQLVRTVNVVTDELYLDRIVIIYQRSAR